VSWSASVVTLAYQELRAEFTPRFGNVGNSLIIGGSYERTSGTLNVKHVSTTIADNDNTFTIPSYDVVDAAVSWKNGPLRVIRRRNGRPGATEAGAADRVGAD
jgi:outer membrane receptor protein involved in Fe transport